MVGIKSRVTLLLSKVCLKLTSKSTLSVMTFHRVGKRRRINKDSVYKHLQFIADHYKTILPSQLVKESTGNRLAMITIDDGHRDVYDTIYPIAKELNIPLVICLSTDFFFRKKWLWFDQLYWLLDRANDGAILEYGNGHLHVGNSASLSAFKQYLKAQLPPERNETLAYLARQLECSLPDSLPESKRAVTLDEMKEMISSGLVEICAHTVTHTIASIMSDDELKKELEEPKKELEKWLNTKVTSFCYPNGQKNDFDKRTGEAVRDAGYEIAFTSVEGINNKKNMNHYEIKRVHAHRKQYVFERNMSGLWFIFGFRSKA